MTPILYIVLPAIWIFLFMLPNSIFDRLSYVWFTIFFLIPIFSDYPKIVTGLHVAWIILGCVFIGIAIWGGIYDCSSIRLDDPQFSWLIKSPKLTVRQAVFRLNCYIALQGIVSIIFG